MKTHRSIIGEKTSQSAIINFYFSPGMPNVPHFAILYSPAQVNKSDDGPDWIRWDSLKPIKSYRNPCFGIFTGSNENDLFSQNLISCRMDCFYGTPSKAVGSGACPRKVTLRW